MNSMRLTAFRSRVTHEVCWYYASPSTPKGETSVVALFLWVNYEN